LVCIFNIVGFYILTFYTKLFANSLFVLPLVTPAVAFEPRHNLIRNTSTRSFLIPERPISGAAGAVFRDTQIRLEESQLRPASCPVENDRFRV